MSGLEKWHMHLSEVRTKFPKLSYKEAQKKAKSTYRIAEKRKCKRLLKI